MKKLIAFVICIIILIGTVAPAVFAEADGKIDLYEVFSNKEDKMKTEVGSRVYKWSMHLPDDAIIYKSEQANYFNMSTTSYQASVNLMVDKNINSLTLEDILYNMQNQSRMGYYWIWGDKEFQVDIATDDAGQRYIRIIKTSGYYDYYLVDNAVQDFTDYIENRIYVANNYTYNLTITMNGQFYREHEDMFGKLASSFKLSFDNENPYIKELSDSVSTTREYKNTSYGWKITLNPYWKVEGTPNARNQSFRPVYTDEELSNAGKAKEENLEEYKVPEGITVSLLGSSQTDETASVWAAREIQKLKDNYNSKVFEILKSESAPRSQFDAYRLVVSYETVTNKPYIIDNLYVVGNGYKYLMSAVMMKEQYQDAARRDSYDTMIKSFTLDKSCLSKYLGKITDVAGIIELSAPKDLKMKKYEFTTKVTKGWNTGSNYYGGYYGGYNEKYMVMMASGNYGYGYGYSGGVSNDEFVYAFQPESNMSLNMSAGLNTNEMDQVITQRVSGYLTDNEIRMGLANAKIQSAEYNGATIYNIVKEYDLDAINKFVSEDKTKGYSFDSLSNEYTYIIKIGKDLYTQTVLIPLANTTAQNMQKIRNIWSNTLINKINYSTASLNWKQHNMEEYDSEKQANTGKG